MLRFLGIRQKWRSVLGRKKNFYSCSYDEDGKEEGETFEEIKKWVCGIKIILVAVVFLSHLLICIC